jgi:hypothetical protein
MLVKLTHEDNWITSNFVIISVWKLVHFICLIYYDSAELFSKCSPWKQIVEEIEDRSVADLFKIKSG